jgi:hypothetical protein
MLMSEPPVSDHKSLAIAASRWSFRRDSTKNFAPVAIVEERLRPSPLWGIAGMAHQVIVKHLAKTEFFPGLASPVVDIIDIESFKHVQKCALCGCFSVLKRRSTQEATTIKCRVW